MSVDKSSTDNSPVINEMLITDLRPEVVSLAREIERLPPGEYMVRLKKPDMTGIPWQVEISESVKLRVMDLWR